MKKYFYILILILPSLLFSNTAVGNITSIRGLADIHRGSSIKQALVGENIFKHDKIKTKDKSRVQVIFKDDTIISIGKNSEFIIDEYLDDSTDDENEVKFSLFKGAMRAITGKIGKANPKKFKVKTKTATIGIRGTNFIIIVNNDGYDYVLCTKGEIIVTGNAGPVNVPSGFMVRISKKGKVEPIEEFNPEFLKLKLKESFLRQTDIENSDASTLKKAHTYIYTDSFNFEIPYIDKQLADLSDDFAYSIITNGLTENTTGNIFQNNVLQFDGFSHFVGVDPNPAISRYGDLFQTNISYGFNYTTGTFTAGSGLTSPAFTNGDTILFNTLSPTIISGTNFKTTFLPFAIFNVTSTTFSTNFDIALDTSVSAGLNQIQTLSDLDANDNLTWGRWNLPVILHDTVNDAFSNQDLTGTFIAGVKTDQSVITSLANAGSVLTYTGNIIGNWYQNASGSPVGNGTFTGTGTTNIDFGANSINTQLTYTANSSAYIVNFTGSYTGNTYITNVTGGTVNASTATLSGQEVGAFYGLTGKTIGSSFSVTNNSGSGFEDITTGVYQAKAP